MSFYVFAVVDRPPSGRPGTGLRGALSLRRVGDAFAVVERRADVPPAEFGSLQRHQAVVKDLAERVPAILPVRFGTLLDGDALDEALHEREEDLADALNTVRGRVQFTWRRGKAGSKGPRGVGHSKAASVSAVSGAEYLRRAARAAKPAPPAAWRPVRSKLAPLIVAEQYQPATGKIPDSLYHLVDRDASLRYTEIARALVHANDAFAMTGPWPPFAFVPALL